MRNLSFAMLSALLWAAVASAQGPEIRLSIFGEHLLGIVAQDISREEAARYGLKEPKGAKITRVFANSPAEAAGLREGDIIIAYDGEPITNSRKLARLIEESPAGHQARVRILRDGKEQELTATLASRSTTVPNEVARLQKIIADMGRNRRIGITTQPLTQQLADYFGVAEGRGLLVASVEANSPAARAGLKAGDVIVEADGEKIATAFALARALNRRTDGDVTLTVVRDRRRITLKVTPEARDAFRDGFGPMLENLLPEVRLRTQRLAPQMIPPVVRSGARIL